MPDVLIHRCTLRVIRRGGWSWGPNPKRLAADAVRVLPELLAKKLSELLLDEEDREIAAPVRIRLSVRLSELAGDSAAPIHASVISGAKTLPSLDQRVESALCAALGVRPTPSATSQPLDHGACATAKFAEQITPNAFGETGALTRLLLMWREHGVLQCRLAALPQAVIATWHDFLSHEAALPPAPVQPSDSDTALENFVLTRAHDTASADCVDILRRRILIALEAAEHFSIPPVHRALWRALDRILPPESSSLLFYGIKQSPGGSATERNALRHESLAVRAEVPCEHTAAPALQTLSTGRQPAEWDVKVACALPFLLLGPLARLGYLAVLDAVLESAKLTREAPLFAAALAYKVLEAPHRGWRRSPEAKAAAAAFASLREDVREESLVDFARQIAPQTAALDLVVADALIAGHTPGEPVLLRTGGADGSAGLLLIDTEGSFPINWTGDLGSLIAVIHRLGNPVVLISREAADPKRLASLDAAGITFLVDVPPARGEHWRRIQRGATVSAWTNFLGPAPEPLRRAARLMVAAEKEAELLVQELVRMRPGVVRASSPELDRSLTLAASAALGTISWKLWQSRGRTSPLQALERFGDLDARISFRTRSVNVRLPLGRRHQELSDGGLLAPVEGVIWMGGRRIEFGGG